MKTLIQNQTYTTIPGLFKGGKIIPSVYVPFKKPAKVIIVFLQSVEATNKKEVGQKFLDSKLYQNKRELTEEEVLKIVKDGEKAYKEGRTENYDTWMLREYPNIYKTNRSYGNKN